MTTQICATPTDRFVHRRVGGPLRISPRCGIYLFQDATRTGSWPMSLPSRPGRRSSRRTNSHGPPARPATASSCPNELRRSAACRADRRIAFLSAGTSARRLHPSGRLAEPTIFQSTLFRSIRTVRMGRAGCSNESSTASPASSETASAPNTELNTGAASDPCA